MNGSFFERERAKKRFALLKEQISLFALFKRATRAIPSFKKSEKSDLLFCFGYKKGEENSEKNKFETNNP